MEKNTPLTSAEIAMLWTTYMNDSMSICVIGYMKKHVAEDDIGTELQFAFDLSTSHLEYLVQLFGKEEMAVPNGFSSSDVNPDAPKLFSDTFCLAYINHMAKAGMLAYSGMLSMSTRSDIRKFFTEGLAETAALYNKTTTLMLEKGIYIRAPYISYPHETDYVDTKKYLSGLNPFVTKRPLNAVEISHLFMNIQTNSIGLQVTAAFAQSARLKEVQEFMLRGKEISQKHVSIFTKTLLDSNIQAVGSPNIAIYDTTMQVFSDKLMMFHMALLSSTGSGNYATAAAASQRSDVAANYERLAVEIALFAKSGADIMIQHGWLEQPPGTTDRDALAKKGTP
jgi:hypothetical protein